MIEKVIMWYIISLFTKVNSVLQGSTTKSLIDLDIWFCAFRQILQPTHRGLYSVHHSDISADQRKQQSSASLAFVRTIHRWPVDSPHKGPVTRKMFPFDDVIIYRFSSEMQICEKYSTEALNGWNRNHTWISSINKCIWWIMALHFSPFLYL